MTSAGNWTNAEGGDGGYTLIDQSTTSTSAVTLYHTFFNGANSRIGFDRTAIIMDGNMNDILCRQPARFRDRDSMDTDRPLLSCSLPNTLTRSHRDHSRRRQQIR